MSVYSKEGWVLEKSSAEVNIFWFSGERKPLKKFSQKRHRKKK